VVGADNAMDGLVTDSPVSSDFLPKGAVITQIALIVNGPGLLGGGRLAAKSATPTDCWTSKPCMAVDCMTKGYPSDGGGKSTASVGSITSVNPSENSSIPGLSYPALLPWQLESSHS
jgi:hypothetical protein